MNTILEYQCIDKIYCINILILLNNLINEIDIWVELTANFLFIRTVFSLTVILILIKNILSY